MIFSNKVVKVKKWLFKIVKYSTLFAIMATPVFLIVSTVTYYMLFKYAGINIETSALLSGIVSAIIIVILDSKKFHFSEKIR